MELAPLIQGALPLALFLVMLGMGMCLRRLDFRRLMVAPRAFALGLGAQFLALPLLASVIVVGFELPPELAVGLLVLSFCLVSAMVLGSYMALTGEPSWRVFSHSLPLSFLISVLLLANEIRDVERDRAHGIHTLSVRIGLNSARRLYWALIACAYGFSALYAGLAWLPRPFWLLIPLPVLVPLARSLNAPVRAPLPPWTGRFLLLLALAYALAL